MWIFTSILSFLHFVYKISVFLNSSTVSFFTSSLFVAPLGDHSSPTYFTDTVNANSFSNKTLIVVLQPPSEGQTHYTIVTANQISPSAIILGSHKKKLYYLADLWILWHQFLLDNFMSKSVFFLLLYLIS